MHPLVSVITPTYGRHDFLIGAQRWFDSQTYPNREWVILDDSPAPSAWFSQNTDPRVRYIHDPVRRTIGEKRNMLVDMAKGEFVAHFDDDDYYAPRYLATMVDALIGNSADLANLCSWYLLDLRHNFFGFWALKTITGLHYSCETQGVRPVNLNEENNAAWRQNYFGYGFSYVYRRSVESYARFADVNWCEEGNFVEKINQYGKFIHIEDTSGLVLHVLHRKSTSLSLPQFHLPTFLMPTLFRESTEFLESLAQKGLL